MIGRKGVYGNRKVQALIALSDAREEDGGLQCVSRNFSENSNTQEKMIL